MRPSLTSSCGGIINHGIGKGWRIRPASNWIMEPHTLALRISCDTLTSISGHHRRDYRSTIRSQEGCNTVLSSSKSARTNSWFLSDFVCRSAAWPTGLLVPRHTQRLCLNYREKHFSIKFDSILEGRKGVGLEDDVVQKLIEVPKQSTSQSYKIVFVNLLVPMVFCQCWLNWLNQHWGRIGR